MSVSLLLDDFARQFFIHRRGVPKKRRHDGRGLLHVVGLDAVEHVLVLRYGSLAEAPVEAETLLKARRTEDEGTDLWTTMNRVQENLMRGGVSDFHRDRRGRLRSVRALRGLDSKVGLNKGLWGLAERVAQGESLPPVAEVALTA